MTPTSHSRTLALVVAVGCLILILACGGGARSTQSEAESSQPTAVTAPPSPVPPAAAEPPVPTAPSEKPTPAEGVTAELGAPVENTTWRITIASVERAATFSRNKPKGQWVIVRGTAENRTTDAELLGKRDFLLATSALNGTIDIDRTATWELGDLDGLEGTVARVGGLPIGAGITVPLLMVFDVPLVANDLTLQLPVVNAVVPLGEVLSLAEWAPPASSESTASVSPTAPATAESNAAEVPLIVDMPGLIGQSVTAVEELLGPGEYPTPFDAGARTYYSGPGETRHYVVDGYRFAVDYDPSGTAVSVWILDGLERDEYDLVDWRTLFQRVGLLTEQGPDVEALAALRWKNLNGNAVEVIKTPRGPVWQIQVSRLE